MGVEPASVGPSVHLCVYSFNMSISATKRLITTKFYLKHHWDGGKAASAFGPDGKLVSVATDSSHRVIIGKVLLPL